MKVDVPVGKSGDWEISRFTVSKQDEQFGKIRMASGHARDYCPSGKYTKLTYQGKIVMTDTPAEWDDLREMLFMARSADRVLLHGLGLGLAVVGLSDMRCQITVVEKSHDVLALCARYYETRLGGRISFIHDDALTWKPKRGEKWDVVWHDIWNDICGDNLPEMVSLCRRFGRRAKWQGCWAREEIR